MVEKDDGDNKNEYKCKVVLLGESGKFNILCWIYVLKIGVGKTSIINKYVHNAFRTNFIPSTSSSFTTKTVDFTKEFGKSIKFEIWDTVGQEKYKAMNKIFYKDSDVAILVYDITRKDSFENLKTFWLNELKEKLKISKVLICFCANKMDLYEYQVVNDGTVTEFCNENEYLFKETSAKNGHGIDVSYYLSFTFYSRIYFTLLL